MSDNTSAEMGKNRTGIAMSPAEGRALVEGANEATPSSSGDRHTQDTLKAPYLEEKARIGSVPPPGSLKGVAKTAIKMIRGEKATVLVDKLAERLAFRACTRGGWRGIRACFKTCCAWHSGVARRLAMLMYSHVHSACSPPCALLCRCSPGF